MDDFFSEIAELMILAAFVAGIVTLLFRFFYGSFKGRDETQRVLREKRVYLPVALGSFILVTWLTYSLFSIRSVAIAFYVAMAILVAMAPVFKLYTRTTWQNAIYLLYSFTVVNLVGFIPLFVLLAGAGLR
jgi:hypothetical protein